MHRLAHRCSWSTCGVARHKCLSLTEHLRQGSFHDSICNHENTLCWSEKKGGALCLCTVLLLRVKCTTVAASPIRHRLGAIRSTPSLLRLFRQVVLPVPPHFVKMSKDATRYVVSKSFIGPCGRAAAAQQAVLVTQGP